ncbi:pilin [Patescibacteria group bacterium]|nr:pilin [Patescibacteria group bacterium]
MKKSALFALTLPVLSAIPMVALAQNFTYVNNWLNQALYWLRLSITVLMIAMMLFFLISVFRFIAEKDPKESEVKKKTMINGIIGLFVAVAVWGLIRIAGDVIGVDTENVKQTPAVTCPPGMTYDRGTGTCRVG